MSTRFLVRRDDLRQTDWEDQSPVPLEDGGVRLRIDAFALTSNNITYATFGDAMNYWAFYPTGDTATGCIPVWGFASVFESRCAGVDVGERFYGYWLIAEEAVLYPRQVDADGFSDGAEHRRHLPSIYNRYVRCSADPAYTADYVDISGDAALRAAIRGRPRTTWPTAARWGPRTGTDSAPAAACRARSRSCSSRPLKPRNARASGARRACRSALPPHGPPSCNR